MNYTQNINFSRYFMILTVVIITIIATVISSFLLNHLKKDERLRMKVWAQSQKAISSNSTEDFFNLVILIGSSNKDIPIVVTDHNKQAILNKKGMPNLHYIQNITQEHLKNAQTLQTYLQSIKSQNPPIQLDLKGTKQYIYYGDSIVLNKIHYYPILIVILILSILMLLYFFLITSESDLQNKLWVGMAKETAHQIGTPLSSLVGWLEILRNESSQDALPYLDEMEKDISRLNIIANRFSKIGSLPKIKPQDIVHITQTVYNYLAPRTSRLINFTIDLPNTPIFVKINEELYGWTLENVVKNAIDAMRGKGNLHIKLYEKHNWIYIQVTDTGKGIPKNQFKKIFEPGYTSKKRGWGLGLSLAKRIIDKYHNGKISVVSSEIDKGSTFQIKLPCITSVNKQQYVNHQPE